MKFLNIFAIAVATTSALRLKTKADPEHEMVAEIIKELDQDGNGTIEKPELLGWARQQLNSACKEYNIDKATCDGYWEEGKKFLSEMFDAADADGNGSVDRKELDAALRSGPQ